MKLTRLFAEGGPALSFEVFPPKAGNNYESVRSATEAIAGLRPAFMSVTCGAGGSTEGFTVSIAKNLKDKFGVTRWFISSHLIHRAGNREQPSANQGCRHQKHTCAARRYAEIRPGGHKKRFQVCL